MSDEYHEGVRVQVQISFYGYGKPAISNSHVSPTNVRSERYKFVQYVETRDTHIGCI